MRLYKGYKKHYQYQTLVNLLLLLFLFVILAFVIKNYFKPFFIIIVLLIISNPMYDLIKKIIQKKEISGALTILSINVLMFCFIFYFGNSIVGLIQSFYINHINELKEWLNTIKVIFNIDLEKFIQNNYHNSIRVTDIADYICLNRSYLTSIFQSNLNMSPQKFLMKFRITKAAELLYNTDLPIANIAYSCGYSDPLAFSKTFKKIKGVSPKQYRDTKKETTKKFLLSQ